MTCIVFYIISTFVLVIYHPLMMMMTVSQRRISLCRHRRTKPVQKEEYHYCYHRVERQQLKRDSTWRSQAIQNRCCCSH